MTARAPIGHSHRSWRILRTVCDIVLIGGALSGAIAGMFWIIRRYLRLPELFAISVIGASGILLVFTSIYGYYIGWVRCYVDDAQDARSRIQAFRRRFRIGVFASLIVLPLGCAAFALVAASNMTAAILLLVIELAVSPWALKEIRAERGPTL